MRRLLKARELGLPEGDTSTLEADEVNERRRRPTGAPRKATHLLLADMLRIRRFEEKCAELYSAGKIRGFLHLYIGEEAVAVGAMQALGPRTPWWPRTASTAMRWRAAFLLNAIMAEMYGKHEGCSRGRGGSMHLFDAHRASTAATRSSAAACRSPSGWRWPTRCSSGHASRRASSARAPSPRASSTSR